MGGGRGVQFVEQQKGRGRCHLSNVMMGKAATLKVIYVPED